MKTSTNTLRHSSFQSLSPVEKITRLRLKGLQSLQSVLQSLSRELQGSDNHLRIWQTGDRPNTLWSAANSRTGQSIYQVSENDLRRWIEHQYNHPSSPLIEQQLEMMNLVRH